MASQSSLFVLHHTVQQQEAGDVTHMEALADEPSSPILQCGEGAVVELLVRNNDQVTWLLHLKGPKAQQNSKVMVIVAFSVQTRIMGEGLTNHPHLGIFFKVQIHSV